ncbi:MAG: indolepyruvate ferredoxin oxidoreductase family protein, partial [Robiginitomaculum sp.]
MQPSTVTLDDKYSLTTGRAFMTGIQALVRLPLDQARRDANAGRNIAGYISGYRGSPLGGYDQQLSAASSFLGARNIVFQEGLNEDLAATAVWGSQQTQLFSAPGKAPKYDGVFGIWYGKAPGVDRCGDVFKHANFSGVSQSGGVLAILGDDPTCKSSTLPSQSEYAMMDCEMPVLNPASVQEVLDYGIYGLAMSRFAGCWTSMIALADTMDGGAVVNVDDNRLKLTIPDDSGLTAARFIKRKDGRAIKEIIHREQRLPAAQKFALANNLDHVILGGKKREIGIVTTGRASRDVYEAMDAIGLTEDIAKSLGLTIFKVGMSWPLEPSAISKFAKGLDSILVVEHKRPLLEDQLKAILYDMPAKSRPGIIGKRRKDGTTLFPDTYVIPVPTIAAALLDILPKGRHIKTASAYFKTYGESIHKVGHRADNNIRSPFYCSGCPHNTSTKLPDGSRALAGIGCHFLSMLNDPNTDMHTQMGGEGIPWLGMAPFTDEPHVFANLGDGTYSHSGSLAIRAAVAANANITYKLLYNDAVAMTGGQTPELAGRSVPHIVTQLRAEAVSKIVVVADDVSRYKGVRLESGVELFPREDLNSVQKMLRETKGVSVIVYDQTCATEKRRRRKRGLMEQEPRRMFINKAVCENCGDCSVQSQCLSIEPNWTEFGLKRIINQSTCNQDLSCVKGFCPSFVTINNGKFVMAKTSAVDFDAAQIPMPSLPNLADTYNILVTGIGGAGVTTISALLGMAAHVDGHAATTLDATGLAQKGGAVTSHVRIAPQPDDIRSGSIPPAATDVVIGGDIIVSHDADVMKLFGHSRTHIVMNSEIVPTAEYLSSRDLSYGKDSMLKDVKATAKTLSRLNAQLLSTQFLGDAIYANMIVLGAAWQMGRVP